MSALLRQAAQYVQPAVDFLLNYIRQTIKHVKNTRFGRVYNTGAGRVHTLRMQAVLTKEKVSLDITKVCCVWCICM